MKPSQSEANGEALRFAREFVANPDKRAQVKVQLAANGWPKLADMIDEAVTVSRAYLALLSASAPQPASEPSVADGGTAQSASAPLSRVTHDAILEAAAIEVESHWNHIDTEVNQHQQAKRSAAAIRKMKFGAADKCSADEERK